MTENLIKDLLNEICKGDEGTSQGQKKGTRDV